MSTSSHRTPGRNHLFFTTSWKNGVPGYGAAMWNSAMSSGSAFENAIVSLMVCSVSPGRPMMK